LTNILSVRTCIHPNGFSHPTLKLIGQLPIYLKEIHNYLEAIAISGRELPILSGETYISLPEIAIASR